MSQSYSANSDLINKIGTSAIKVTNLSSVNDTLSDAVNQLSINFDGINDLVKNNYITLRDKLNEVITYINAHMSEDESPIKPIGDS